MMSALQAMDKAKEVMIISIISIIIKCLSLFFLTYLNIGMLSLLFSSLLAYVYLTISLALMVKKGLKKV